MRLLASTSKKLGADKVLRDGSESARRRGEREHEIMITWQMVASQRVIVHCDSCCKQWLDYVQRKVIPGALFQGAVLQRHLVEEQFLEEL